MRIADFPVLSFDCYGTLIDWERGIAAALRRWARSRGREIEDDELVAGFARFESEAQQAAPTSPYPEVLAAVLRRLGGVWQLEVSDDDAAAFGASVGDWPPFDDAAAALAELGRHHQLVILSNVDRASLAGSQRLLGLVPDAVVVAEEVGCYKPDPRMFDALITTARRLGHGPASILHVAQSLYHDLVPATRVGLTTAWINRRADREGWGATPPPPGPVMPVIAVDSLAELVALRRAAAR